MKHDPQIGLTPRDVETNAMNCPTCNSDISNSYEPGGSAGICSGWFCDACEVGVREHEVHREPMAGDVEIEPIAGNIEIMPTQELPGERPLEPPLAELPSPNGISMEVSMPPDGVSADVKIAEPTEVVPAAGAPHERLGGFTWNNRGRLADPSTVAPRRPKLYLASAVLMIAALALGAAGIAINGYFSLSLGASDFAGWLFLAVGVAADLAALVLPGAAAGLWQGGQRLTAMVGWVVWLVAFLFAVTASVGFASMNIMDAGLARASRVTPAITISQAALTDAMAARDRECKVVGRYCRDREAAVAEQRRLLDAAMTSVGQAADPQTDAAIKLVAWISRGMMRPAPEDFAMLRLILLALLPQIGGMLLLIGRRSQTTGRLSF